MKRAIVLTMFSVVLLSGCYTVGGGVRVEGKPAPVGNMPPAHAPAYGRRQQHYRYYYYPNAEFYFDMGRNVYFYLDSRGRWAVSASLPQHLRGYIGGYRVELDMESDKPYTQHHQHQQKYKKQPHQQKKKPKPKVTGKHGKKKYQDEDDHDGYRHNERRY